MHRLSRPGLLLVVALSGLAAETAVPVAAPFAGTWRGQVIAPNGRTDISFAFQPTAKGLFASFSMPAMFVHGLNLGPARIADSTYTMPDLNIRLDLDGGRLTGTFANPLLHVELTRGDPIPPLPAQEWPAAPAAAWSHALGAQTWASPATRDGMVYVGCVDGKFHAIRAADGSEAWTWGGPNPLYGAALLTAGSVYFIDSQCDLVCLARADGSLKWRTPLHDETIAGGPAPGNETFNHRTAVPVLDGGTLYAGSTDQGLYALDAATGKILWRHDIGARIYAAVALQGDNLVLAAFDGSVVVLNRHTHREVLRTKVGGPIASAPVVAGDIVVVGCRDYLLYGLKLADLSVAWRDSFWFSWVESVPEYVDGTLYVGGSDYRRVSALNPANGEARWVAEVGGLTWGTPVVTASRVYAGTSAQNPAAIRHQGGITALDRASGTVQWRHATPLPDGAERAGYLGSLVLAADRIIGAGFDGVMVAFTVDRGRQP